MTLEQLFIDTYAWAVQHGNALLAASVAWPLAGVIAARIGKGGKTDTDGRLIASVVVGVAIGAASLVALALLASTSAARVGLLQADLRLLLAPPLCIAGSLLGMRLVFPLSSIGSVRALRDVGALLLVGAGLLWLLSKFRGWGIFFVGSLGEMVVLFGLGFAVLRRLFRRATGSGH